MHQQKNKLLFHEIIATGFFTGYIPLAPGTAGAWSAACLALILTNIFLFPVWKVSLVGACVCFIIGVYSSNYLYVATQEKDPSYIVIDEFAGMFLSYALVPLTLTNFLLGFLLFRFFDIVKPWPIRRLESFPSGWGVMLDDMLAGVYAGLILYLMQYIYT